jgi:hypothetical protein
VSWNSNQILHWSLISTSDCRGIQKEITCWVFDMCALMGYSSGSTNPTSNQQGR